MTSILCLAHFCEVHGPTPLMVTEGLPVKCNSCGDHDVPDLMMAVASAVNSAVDSVANSTDSTTSTTSTTSSSSSTPHAAATVAATAATHAVADALRKMNLDNSQKSPASSTPARSATPRSHPDAAASKPSAYPTTPPSKSSSNFRKTYDDAVTKRAVPCDNCAMTLPGNDTRNPTLRTRVPCGRVYDNAYSGGSPSPFLHPSSSSSASSSTSSDEGDDHRAHAHHSRHGHYPHHRRTGTMTSVATSRSSTSSSASRLATSSHTHYLDYTSTHEPVSANAFGIIRQSCLRTLTLETLPRSPVSSTASSTASQPPTPLQMSPASSYFSAAGSHFPGANAASANAAAAATANGGPLFFGDKAGGYTTAHVFRVADMHARGHKRVYALIALNTHRERMAMKAFGFVSAAFNDLATWIQQLADAEAERVAISQCQERDTGNPAASSAATAAASASASASAFSDRSPPPTQPSSLSNTGGSSFLVAAGNGLSRRMGPGYAGFGGLGSSSAAAASLRARGLPEILGMPNFFIELHTRFVRLLLELGVALS